VYVVEALRGRYVALTSHTRYVNAMKFAELLETVGDLPLFRSSLLLAGDRDVADVRRQLARWTQSGRVVQLRRNVYVLAAPWRRVEPHPFVIANQLHGPSYVSLQSALGHYGVIPEAVPVVTSVTAGRPMAFDTPLGRYSYRHLQARAFFGYGRVPMLRDQDALVAGRVKALLDLVYLTPGGEATDHLESLRLEELHTITAQDLRAHARRWGKGKISRAVENLLSLKQGVAVGAGRA
jgi:predicted transcriptional regulator of viral defense system